METEKETHKIKTGLCDLPQVSVQTKFVTLQRFLLAIPQPYLLYSLQRQKIANCSPKDAVKALFQLQF